MKRNNEHNEFVGNFDNFFDNESSLTGGLDFDSPISDPVVIPTPPILLGPVGPCIPCIPVGPCDPCDPDPVPPPPAGP